MPFHIFMEHNGQRYAWCGFAARFWFAQLPCAAAITFADSEAAVAYARDLPERFERYVIHPGEPDQRYFDPAYVKLFVD